MRTLGPVRGRRPEPSDHLVALVANDIGLIAAHLPPGSHSNGPCRLRSHAGGSAGDRSDPRPTFSPSSRRIARSSSKHAPVLQLGNEAIALHAECVAALRRPELGKPNEVTGPAQQLRLAESPEQSSPLFSVFLADPHSDESTAPPDPRGMWSASPFPTPQSSRLGTPGAFSRSSSTRLMNLRAFNARARPSPPSLHRQSLQRCGIRVKTKRQSLRPRV